MSWLKSVEAEIKMIVTSNPNSTLKAHYVTLDYSKTIYSMI